MRYIWTRHIREQMERRNITEDEVRAVLADHDLSRETDEPSIVYTRRVNGRSVSVATVPPGISGRDPNLKVVLKTAWAN